MFTWAKYQTVGMQYWNNYTLQTKRDANTLFVEKFFNGLVTGNESKPKTELKIQEPQLGNKSLEAF